MTGDLRKTIFYIVILMLLIFVFMIIVVSAGHNRLYNSNLQKTTMFISTLIENKISEMDKKYRRRTDGMMRTRPDLHKAFADRDLDTLIIKTADIYRVANSENKHLTTVAWILPNGELFLRYSASGERTQGDFSHLPIVRDLMSTGTEKSGFSLTKHGLHYRVFTPIYDNGELKGFFGVVIRINILTNHLREYNEDMEFAVIVKKRDNISINNNDFTLTCKKYFSNNYSGIFSLMYNSGIPLEDFVNKEKIKYENHELMLIKNTLYDYNGEKIGYFVAGNDIGSLTHSYYKSLVKITAVFFISMLLIVLIIYRFFKKLIVKLIINEQELLEQKKVADMGQMLSAIAHHWRQPLNAVGLNIQDVIETYKEGNLDEKYIQRFETVTMGVLKEMSSKIDDFAQFFTPSSHIEEFSVSDAVHSACSLVSAELSGAGINLNVTVNQNVRQCSCLSDDCALCSDSIKGYQTDFKQVILHLVRNSKEAVQKRIQTGVEDGFVEVSVINNDDKIVIEVTDNGGGIPEENFHKIWDPYYSTKGVGSNFGLGLYFVKNIIELHMNGNVEARPVEDGLKVTVILEKANRS